MKNLDMLKTGSKPAPGQLVIIQGLVNTLEVESGVDEIGTRELLEAWLARHGLLGAGERVSAADLKTALSLREALRSLLLANNGVAVRPSALKQLNHLLAEFPLVVSCDPDGTPLLVPSGGGRLRVFGLILSQIMLAMSQGTWSRLKACSEEHCQWAFYDSSKNHSGRWCSMSVCGSREKARSYRKRRSAIA